MTRIEARPNATRKARTAQHRTNAKGPQLLMFAGRSCKLKLEILTDVKKGGCVIKCVHSIRWARLSLS